MCIDEVATQDSALNLTGSGLMIELSYETLCSRVDDTLAVVCRHLDLDTTRFKPTGRIQKVASRNYKWKGDLGEEVKQQVSAILRSELVARGYESVTPGSAPGGD